MLLMRFLDPGKVDPIGPFLVSYSFAPLAKSIDSICFFEDVAVPLPQMERLDQWVSESGTSSPTRLVPFRDRSLHLASCVVICPHRHILLRH